MTWDPAQYLRFDDHRARPASDLIGRVARADMGEIWDLGCGTGTITAALAAHWPTASVHGLDSSPEMLARAPVDAGIDWTLGDIAAWQPGQPVDLVFSNAALHWIPDHDIAFPRLMETLSPGGVLAVQMPRNHSAPSHRVLFDTARSDRWAPRLSHLVVEAPVGSPAEYHAWLSPHASSLDIWETTYQHALTGADPVAQWTRGSVMRPYLDELGDEADDFFVEYTAALRAHYPVRSDGITLFEFRRLFIVAVR